MSNLEYLYNFCDIKIMRIFLKLKGEKKKEKEKEACRSHYWDVPQMTNPQWGKKVMNGNHVVAASGSFSF